MYLSYDTVPKNAVILSIPDTVSQILPHPDNSHAQFQMYLYIQARNLKWHYPITVFKKLRPCLHTAESAPNLKFWPICDISVGYRDTILMYSGYCSLHPKHHTSYQDISCGFCFPSFILRTRLCILIVIPMLFFLAIDRECVVVKLGVPLEGVPLIPSWWDMPNATWRRFHTILI